ncbi:MAG: sigma-70 family RNA polymerase sigma factor [Bacteroidales bacterium]|nr:sigma-70 family RNA polymerase sigma factor [Bacteroidales bacterium]
MNKQSALPDTDLKDLIQRCLKRDVVAQKRLYDTYSPKMLALCIRYMGDREAGMDVLQDGFVTVFSKLRTYKGEGSFEGWMRKIFVNEALMALRKNDVLRYADKIDNVPAAHMMASNEDAVSRMGAKELTKLIESMPPGYRAVFNLSIDGFQHDEIARMLGISSASSRSQLSRARDWLQKRIKELY